MKKLCAILVFAMMFSFAPLNVHAEDVNVEGNENIEETVVKEIEEETAVEDENETEEEAVVETETGGKKPL